MPPADHGRGLAEALFLQGRDAVHAGQNTALSLTNATEWGTVYSVDEVTAPDRHSPRSGLSCHMDGRVSPMRWPALDVAPADLTWQAGIDDAVAWRHQERLHGRRGGDDLQPGAVRGIRVPPQARRALVSKHRFLAAQLLAWFEGDLWLQLARHANAMAHELALGLARLPGVRIDQRVETNAVFRHHPLSPAPAGAGGGDRLSPVAAYADRGAG